jgi:hypothetical protein
VSQFVPISSALAPKAASTFGWRSTWRSQPHWRREVSSTPRNSRHHSTRCARICGAGTVVTRRKYSGNSPHQTKASVA